MKSNTIKLIQRFYYISIKRNKLFLKQQVTITF